MKTIATWYESNTESAPPVGLDIHINFWKLLKKKDPKNPDYLLDIGFMVHDISVTKKIHIHFPFNVSLNDIHDLGGTLKDHQILINSVFNESYEIRNPPQGRQLSVFDSKSDSIIFNIYSLDFSNTEGDATITKRWCGSHLCLDVSSISPLQHCNKYYFRFRIAGNAPKSFRKDYTPKDRFFKSAFTATEVIDFRLNEKRNYHPVLAETINDQNEFAIKKIHFLLMRKAYEDFDSSHINASCRVLEKSLWGKYVGDEYDLDNVLAYHWSEKGSVDKCVESFNSLVKMKYHRSNWLTICAYILVIGILSIPFNLLSSLIWKWVTPSESPPQAELQLGNVQDSNKNMKNSATSSTQTPQKVVIVDEGQNSFDSGSTDE